MAGGCRAQPLPVLPGTAAGCGASLGLLMVLWQPAPMSPPAQSPGRVYGKKWCLLPMIPTMATENLTPAASYHVCILFFMRYFSYYKNKRGMQPSAGAPPYYVDLPSAFGPSVFRPAGPQKKELPPGELFPELVDSPDLKPR